MEFTKFVKRHGQVSALLILVIFLYNLIMIIPFYGIDPHSSSKSEYFYGHSGTVEAGKYIVWNRNLHGGMPQYDKVFWHCFTGFYYLMQARWFYALIIVAAALGVFFFCRRSQYNLAESLLLAFIYGISFHFLEFLNIWVYGWGLMLVFVPWFACLLLKLKKNGSLADIAVLAILLIMCFELYETEVTIYLLTAMIISVMFSFVDSFDSSINRQKFWQYLWKLLLAVFLAMVSVITVYMPLLQARNQDILNPLIRVNIWRIAAVVMLTALIFITVRLGKYRLALYIGIGLLVLADTFVLVQYVPWLDKYQQCPINSEQGTEIRQHLQADSTHFRIFPFGKEFQENLWTVDFESIGGKDQFAFNRYSKMIRSCLTAEIDKNLEINWNLLSLLNVKYIISNIKIPSDRLEYSNYSYTDQLITYRIKHTMPYAWFAGKWQVESIDEIASAINKPEFDPRETALLETEIPEFTDKSLLPESTESSVIPEIIQAEYIKIRVNNSNAGLLVISEIYDEYDQWQAYIDSIKTAIYPVDYTLRGVVTPPGEHVVEMWYEPDNQELYHRISYWARMMILILLLTEVFYRLWLRLL
ncbi:MAG: hypothetical protein K9M99_09785 [Candidatus Cloacimonetes bacterium]|nr:hypothetical protein [Candidatus Cloacimonadota bacterium]